MPHPNPKAVVVVAAQVVAVVAQVAVQVAHQAANLLVNPAVNAIAVALLRAVSALEGLKISGDQQFGVDIARRAIEEPLRQIVLNAGGEPSIVVEEVLSGEGAYGYNARTSVFEDLIVAGVLDPMKVTRAALQNAASVAGLLLTTEALIAETDEDEDGH